MGEPCGCGDEEALVKEGDIEEDEVAAALVAATPAGVKTRGYCSCVNQCDETERGGLGSTLAMVDDDKAMETTFKSRSSVKYK